MKTSELLKPRFKLIADYPNCAIPIGSIISNSSDLQAKMFELYPHLFQKVNWWEERKKEEMPKKVMSLLDNDKEVKEIYEIEEWDMDILVGWIDKKERICCSLTTFNPEYGYIPVD